MSEELIFPVVGEVDYEQLYSREITKSPKPPSKGALLSAVVQCPACGHIWKSFRGAKSGGMLPVLAAQQPIDCESCDASGVLGPRL